MDNEILKWFKIILFERFGIEFFLEDKNDYVSIKTSLLSNRCILIKVNKSFYQLNSEISFNSWTAENEGWKSIFKKPIPAPGLDQGTGQLITKNEDGLIIDYDIFGLTYWMLNRLEEINYVDLDQHFRFRASSSHAYKNNYLNRPIVDEWLDILAQVIVVCWPSIIFRNHEFDIKVSHDVDVPSYYGFKKLKPILRILAGHLLKRKDLKEFFITLKVWLNSSQTIDRNDPANTFDWIMDLSDSHNITSAFYFICGKSNYKYDADYELNHPAIKKLLHKINFRNHEIGLHPSYEAYLKKEVLLREAAHLKQVCSELGIHQSSWGGRMHYLRWSHPKTLDLWEEADMSYDSTLGYADSPGFRCGTCFEYIGFNPITYKILKVKIRPLIAMESSVIDQAYLGLGETKEAIDKFLELGRACKEVKGTFTLLWHNSELTTESKRNIYKEVLSGI